MNQEVRKLWVAALTLATLLAIHATPMAAQAGIRLKDICRVKGQEENTLQGLGLVVGLSGTGDGGNFLPAIRSLATAMQLLGNPIGKAGAAELKDARNVALVMVTATVPAAGAREGDKIDCVVSSIGAAKSLVGGRLFLSPLTGPAVDNPQVYAFASGPIEVDDPRLASTGRIHQGCRLEADFFNAFANDGIVTLVLDTNHADFQIAQAIAQRINEHFDLQSGGKVIAQAINQGNIKVAILPQNRDDPVDFIAQLMGLQVLLEPAVATDARVVINERTGSIVIDGRVEIGSVVVTHRNIVIETGNIIGVERFVPLSPGEEPTTELTALVEALNSVKVPTDDIIDIIKGLERSGKLHARLIIE